MASSSPTNINAWLLQLYRLSSESPLEEFQEAALSLLRKVLQFDTAIWGSGTLAPTGMLIDELHVHSGSQGSLPTCEEHQAADREAFAAGHGLSNASGLHSLMCRPNRTEHLEVVRRYRCSQLFISADTDGQTRRSRWVSLYRAGVSDPFSDADHLRLQDIRPHLMRALDINRQLHLARLSPVKTGVAFGFAFAGSSGTILQADAPFVALIRTEWPGWEPGALTPAALAAAARKAGRYTGQHVVVQARVGHPMLLVRVRSRCLVDTLSARELEIALRMAQGDTHKEAAVRLSRSPSTVRNHLQAIYAKLQVNNLAGLVGALRHAGLPECHAGHPLG